MPTKIQGGLGIDKVQDGTVGMSDVDTELYGKITALTTINLGEAKTASGTFVDFDVPLGVKRVTVMFDGVSTNGTSNELIQLGDISGVSASGYLSASLSAGATTLTTSNSTVGFVNEISTTASLYNGALIISKINSNTWVATGTFADSVDKRIRVISGSKTLSGPLDRIRITTVNGTDQFDAGTINISWEF